MKPVLLPVSAGMPAVTSDILSGLHLLSAKPARQHVSGIGPSHIA
jgi:hypothetical protein